MTPDPAALEQYLHAHIPLSRAMDVRVLSCGPGTVLLEAPLAPNINHRETVFGGSASAVAILAAWSLLHVRLASKGLSARLVIQRNEMEYLAPIDGNFQARAAAPDPDAWEQFLRMLRRKGRARITVASELAFATRVVGRLRGEFVALAGASPA